MSTTQSLTWIFVGAIFIGPFLSWGNIYLYHMILPFVFPTLLIGKLGKVRDITVALTFLLFVWPIVSTFWMKDINQGFISILHVFIMLVNILLTRKFYELDKENLDHAILFFYLINLLIGYLEFFDLYSRTDLNHLELGALSLEKSRGFQYNPNNFTFSLYLFIPFIFAKLHNGIKWKILLISVIYMIFVNGSRSVLISVVFLLILNFNFIQLKFKKKNLLSLFILFCAFALLLFISWENAILQRALNIMSIVSTLASADLSDGGSNAIRFMKYMGVLTDYLEANWILGLGAGGSYEGGMGAPHLGVFQYFFEFGLIFLLPFIAFLYGFFRLRKLSVFNRYMGTCGLLSIIAAMSISSTYYFLPFHLFIGYMTVLVYPPRERN